jgi:hypothetical protein
MGRVVPMAGRAKLSFDASVDEQPNRELEELLVVDSGWDVLANEETFIVLVFRQRVWVIPELTPGANALLFEAWQRELSTFPHMYRARIDMVPRAWRARRFWLPMPRPKLGSFAKSTLPAWGSKVPITFEMIPRIGSE